MTTNPILDEIHKAREMLLAEHNGDLHAYVEAARKRALESGRTILQPKQRIKPNPEGSEQAVENDGPTPSIR